MTISKSSSKFLHRKMKHLSNYDSFGINENDLGVRPDSPEWKEFLKLMRSLDFAAAFSYAQDAGIFGGNLEEYLNARARQGPGFKHLLQSYNEYREAAEIFAEDVIEDLEDAQNNYGH